MFDVDFVLLMKNKIRTIVLSQMVSIKMSHVINLKVHSNVVLDTVKLLHPSRYQLMMPRCPMLVHLHLILELLVHLYVKKAQIVEPILGKCELISFTSKMRVDV